MRTNSVLTPSKVRYVHVTPSPFNEYKLLTHTLQATCGTLLTSEYLLTFPLRLVQTPYSHLARCGTFTLLHWPCNENKLLTHTLRATCGTLLSSENELASTLPYLPNNHIRST